MKELGVEWIRNEIPWAGLENPEGHWDFSRYDAIMELAARYDIKVLIVLAYDVSWIYEEGEKRRNITPDKLPAFLDYVRRIARRYGEQAAGFEVWNEPNTPLFWKGSNSDFFELTRETVSVLKAAAPEVPVAIGSIFYHPIMRGRSYLKKMIAAGLFDQADALAVHPYGLSLSKAASRVADAGQLLKKHGYDKDIWISEIGFTTGGWYPNKTSVEGQAFKVLEAITRLSAAGADLVCWFKLMDGQMPEDVARGTSSEEFFGLAYPDFSVKPSGKTFSLLSEALSGSVFSAGGVELSGPGRIRIESFRYDREEETIIVLWNNGRSRHMEISGFQGNYTSTNLISGSRSVHNEDALLLAGKEPLLLRGTMNRQEQAIGIIY